MSALKEIAAHLSVQAAKPVLRVAVDGVDGVGKTTFADCLAEEVRSAGRNVIRASVDQFHNPRSIRYRFGRTAESFYRDSFDYNELKQRLLDPLSRDGSLIYKTSIFDYRSDSPTSAPDKLAATGSVLIFDGLFLHRPELRMYWDFSIYLDAPFEVTVPRGASRGPGFGDPNPSAASNSRYIGGNLIYFGDAAPQARATVVIDYTDFSSPEIVDWKGDPR